MIFKKSAFDDPDDAKLLDDGFRPNYPRRPTEVQFNTCSPDGPNADNVNRPTQITRIKRIVLPCTRRGMRWACRTGRCCTSPWTG